jgi:hypothetical protein
MAGFVISDVEPVDSVTAVYFIDLDIQCLLSKILWWGN